VACRNLAGLVCVRADTALASPNRAPADETRALAQVKKLGGTDRNTITTTLGIVEQSLRSAATKKEALRAIRERLAAIGKAHDLLIENKWISADIREVVAGAVSAYIGDGARVAMTGERILLTFRAALILAMLLNELSTNAIKYGAWSTEAGQVVVSWVIEGNQFHFRWAPLCCPPRGRASAHV
jgi:two-component sensor histidine kinase